MGSQPEIREITPGATGGDAGFVGAAEPGLFSALFRSIPGRAALLDTGCRYRLANQEFFDFVGRPADEVIGARLADVFGEAFFEAYRPVFERLLAGEPLRREGWVDYGRYGRRYVLEAFTPCRPREDGPVEGFFTIVRDLTDLKQGEREIARRIESELSAEAYNAAIVRNALDGIVVVDEKGLVLDFNPAAEIIFGYPREAALGRSVASLIIPPDYREAHAAGMRAYLESGSSKILGKRLELPAMRADGARIPIELTITDVTRDGRRLFAAHIRDLSEAKRAEEEIRRQRNALYQKEKLAALGSLLAGVAHELNNPLSIVTGQTMMLHEQLAEAALPDGSSFLARCERIENAANRCARIVRSFLAMARQREAERQPTDLAQVIREAVELLSYNMRSSGVAIELDVASDLPALMLDGGQIHQVLVNLLVNAQQALDESGLEERRIRISLRADDAAGWVELAVNDNGPGIPQAIRTRIFDPFFTTKQQGVGTGIGLAVSRGLVEVHGGSLEVGDAPEGGARFLIRLPLEPAPAPAEEEMADEPAAAHATGKAGTVLIVDDEAEIAGLLAEIVGRFGYETVIASSGQEARGTVTRLGGKVDAILCDIRMPSGDGPSLYDWLKENHPGLSERIGFITGDTLGPSAGRFLARSGRPMLEKPFRPEDIEGFLEDLTTPGGRYAGA